MARWGSRFRIAAWDARGHGESPRFTQVEIDAHPIRTMYRDLAAAVDELTDDGSRPLVLVGHSLGAGLAAELGAHLPRGGVQAIVLEEPPWYREIDWTRRRYKAATVILAARTLRDDPAAGVAAVRAENPRWPPDEATACAAARAMCDDAFIATAEAFLPTPWRLVPAAIAVPTLIVTGTEGVVVTAESIREIEQMGNPHLTVRVVEGAGHNVRRDNPEGYHAVVDPWLFAHAG